MTTEGVYRNMRSLDIGDYTANVDTLFHLVADTVGIGDGGNEIGMGNLADEIRAIPALPDDPAATGCAHLVIASVSNWGGYGLVAALSRLAGRNLLPALETEVSWVTRSAEMGAVDGYLAKPVASVDGFAARALRRPLVKQLGDPLADKVLLALVQTEDVQRDKVFAGPDPRPDRGVALF